ncbi:MAG: hypothetical protein A2Y31_08250 [Spirochaetes bacterium GWC2_52_13]|nr:MAG: hypothetical protein A2Y31_08250 [Spirochaetes bacterium GWC2_52_13]HCG64365.1 toxin HipA [Sphaerochaeta sp.]
MARRMKSRTLFLYMNGKSVGTWHITAQGIHELHYDPTWVEDPAGRPISLSLPFLSSSLVHRGPLVESFFENLLPESEQIRRKFQTRYRAPSIRAFDLLYEIGRDCVGALQLLADPIGDFVVPPATGRAVAESEIADLLRDARTGGNQFGSHIGNELRISLAGVQEKTALLRMRDTWYIPEGPTGTTHILKLPLGELGGVDLRNSVEIEWLTTRIFALFGLQVANTTIETFEDQKVLVVERFDRRWDADHRCLYRLPQEDMCQALGYSSGFKYESDGGPGIREIMRLLNGSANRRTDTYSFMKSLLLNWLLAAPDAHAKNFSIFHNPGGTYRLTPFYDLMSAYPVLGARPGRIPAQKLKMAMAIRTKHPHYHHTDIGRRHWIEMGMAHGFSEMEMNNMVDQALETVPTVAGELMESLPTGFPLEVFDAITTGILKTANRLR